MRPALCLPACGGCYYAVNAHDVSIILPLTKIYPCSPKLVTSSNAMQFSEISVVVSKCQFSVQFVLIAPNIIDKIIFYSDFLSIITKFQDGNGQKQDWILGEDVLILPLGMLYIVPYNIRKNDPSP